MNLKLLRAEWRAVRRASMQITQRGLAVVGLFAIAGFGVVTTHPDAVHVLGGWIAPAGAAPAAVASAPDPLTGALADSGSEASRMLGLNAADRIDGDAPTAAAGRPVVSTRERQDAVNYLARKYRVNPDALAMLVDAAYTTGRELNLDPLLLLSVMAVESGFNPFAESTAGASGLMQLMSKVHADKLADFGGPNIALNPIVNLRVGALVLKDCIRRGGSITDGLRLYVGAGMGDDSGYGARVLQEKDRLAQAVHGVAHPRVEPIPSTTAKVRSRQPDIDHSMDNVDPTDPKVDASAGRVAAL
jgi:soluble lytic murein transglycosylase-like protein